MMGEYQEEGAEWDNGLTFIPGIIKFPPLDVLFKNKYTLLLEKWLEENPYNSSVTKCYDVLLGKTIPDIISHMKIKMNDKKGNKRIAVITDITIIPPTINNKNESYPMTPHDAFIYSKTYAVSIYCHVTEYNLDEYEKVTSMGNGYLPSPISQTKERIKLCDFPIPIGSKYCNWGSIPHNKIADFGERYQYKQPYFIVNGTAYAIEHAERLRHGMQFIFSRKANTGGPSCSMTNDTDVSSSVTNISKRIIDKTANTHEIILTLGGVSRTTDDMKKANAPVNVITFIRAIYQVYVNDESFSVKMNSVENVVNTIESLCHPDHWDKVESALSYTIFLSLKDKKPVPIIAESIMAVRADVDRENENIIKEYMKTEILAIKGLSIELRIKTLMTMIIKYCMFISGIIGLSDRNIFENKKLCGASRVMEQSFKQSMKWLNKTLEGIDKKNVNNLKKQYDNLEQIVSVLSGYSNKFFEDILKVFITSSWSNGSNVRSQCLLLAAGSVASLCGQCGRLGVSGGVHKSMNIEVRSQKPSQLGYVCVGFCPQTELCGLTRELAITCESTYHVDISTVTSLLNGKISLNMINSKKKNYTTKLFINGMFYGWCDGTKIDNFIRSNRRAGKLSPYISTFIDNDGDLKIYTDSGRFTRPLLILDENQRPIIHVNNWWDRPIIFLMANGAIELLDSSEITKFRVASKLDDIIQRDRDIETCKRKIYELENIREKNSYSLKNLLYYQNELEVLINNPFTHLDIHESVIYGPSYLCCPIMSRNQPAKNIGQANMNRQGMEGRNKAVSTIGGKSKSLLISYKPFLPTAVGNTIGFQVFNKTIAMMCWNGQSIEDAIIIHEKALNNMVICITNNFKLQPSKTSNGDVSISMPDISMLHDSEKKKYRFIDPETGLPYINAPIMKGDVLLGMVSRNGDKLINCSHFASKDEVGIVIHVGIESTSKGIEISIDLLHMRLPIKGDKITLIDGQKATIGAIYPSEMMPKTALGEIPDILVNSHAIKRMTMSLPYEMVCGVTALLSGKQVNATGYDEECVAGCIEINKKIGYCDKNGYCYRKFEGIESEIHFGVMQIIVLRYFGDSSKIKTRNSGKDARTRQTPKGPNSGVKVPQNMRPLTIYGHNCRSVDKTIRDRADGMTIVVCSKCGAVVPTSINLKSAKCDICASGYKNFCKMEASFSTILLIQDSRSAAIDIRFKTNPKSKKSNELYQIDVFEEEEDYDQNDDNEDVEGMNLLINDDEDDDIDIYDQLDVNDVW